jgi:hypothetical protein
MGPIQVVVEDGNNIVLEVTPTPDTTVILDRGIPGPVGPMGDGDVDGPASSTDNAVARFNGTTGKVIQNSNVTIDDSGNLTYSAGTANGVAYLNGSKVLTTGSALTFDGTNLLNDQSTASPIGLRLKNGSASTSAGTRVSFEFGGATTGYVGNQFDGSDFNNQYQANRHHIWLNGATEQMRLTSTGLGIGTSSPTAKLDVLRGTDGLTAVFGGANTSRALTITSAIGGSSAGAMHTFGAPSVEGILAFSTATVERMCITAAGNVGIGTSSPATKLEVDTYSLGYGITFSALNSTGRKYQMGLYAAGGGNFGLYDTAAAALRLVVDTSGNLGLGVTPSAWSGTNTKALDISLWTSLANGNAFGSALTFNGFYNGTNWIYKQNNSASKYESDGVHRWYTAPSGVANSTSITTGVVYVVAALGASTLAQWQAFFSGLAALPTVGQSITATATGTLVGGGTVTQTITFTQAMTLNASGNLGIGTSSPGVKLDVVGVARASTRVVSPAFYGSGTGVTEYMDSLGTTGMYVTGAGASPSNSVRFFSAGTTTATLDSSGNLGLGVTPSAWSTFKALDISNIGSLAAFPSFDVGLYRNCYYNGSNYIYKTTDEATYYAQDAAGKHIWFTAPSGTAGNAISFTQAMTLTAAGDLLVGTTSTRGVGTTIYSPGGIGRIDINKSTSGTATAMGFYHNGSIVGSISYSDTATAFNTTSDQRLKENIVDAPEFGSVIDSIKVRSYDWKTDQTHQRAGFIAQELVTVAPEAVHQPADPEEMMAVDYSKLVPMLVKEIQSLRARLAALEAA